MVPGSGQMLDLRLKTPGRGPVFRYQAIISWNLVYKSLLTPVRLDLHPSCHIKGDQSTITAIIWDYTTNIPTFKLRLKKLLLNTQHPTDSPDAWSKIDTLLHTA